MRFRMLLVLPFAVWSFGCGNDASGSDLGGAIPPPLGACLSSDGAASVNGADDAALSNEPVSASFEGRVEEIGLGLPDPGAGEAGCPLGGDVRFGDPRLEAPETLAQTSWLGLRDANDRRAVVSALAEGFAFPLAPGDVVRAQIARQPAPFEGNVPDVTSFEARRADGSLLIWIGAAATVDELQLPSELGLSPGAVERELDDRCAGPYALRALNVEAGAMASTIPYGERATLGSWVVLNAAVREQTGTGSCPGGGLNQVRVAVWALDAQVPETGGIGGPCYAELPIEQGEGQPEYACRPDGTLTRSCSTSAPCPGASTCEDGSCRLAEPRR